MNSIHSDIADSVCRYCAEIGADPLLVQGAGGNISWKDNKILWVKASGRWLAGAQTESIFVPVDLNHLRGEISQRRFSAVPEVIGDVELRPSIETMLHALMPHPVVLHLHPIELLAHLVRANFIDDFENLLGGTVSYSIVDYARPGAGLAAKVYEALAIKPHVDVIFLRNHGVVIGGEDIAGVDRTLREMTSVLAVTPLDEPVKLRAASKLPGGLDDQYTAAADFWVQQLALSWPLFKRLSADWALYPDHVVFLGASAHTYLSWGAFFDGGDSFGSRPELIFVFGEGVYTRPSFSKAKLVQLRCYFDIISRQKTDDSLVVLTNDQIAELLDWDMERYRMDLAR